MSSNRSQTADISSESSKSNSTHWVCCIANETFMKEQTDLWIGNCNTSNGKYEKTSNKSPIFDKINNVDVLHIYGHGEKNKNVIYHGNESLTPKDFLKFLKENKLDAGHKYIEINACYTEEFAKEIAIIAKDDYPNLRVSGYPGQFVPCQGINGENLANLEEPYVIQDKGRWYVNGMKLNKDNITEYYAEKHRKDFYTNPEQKQEFSSTVQEAVSFSSSSAATSSPNMISHPYHTRRHSTSSYTDYASTTRDSLPGKMSWSQVLALSPVAAVEIKENNIDLNQSVVSDVEKALEPDTHINSNVLEVNDDTSTLELSLGKTKIDDIITDNDEKPSPTPRR